MELFLIPTVWLPILCLAFMYTLTRLTKTPRNVFIVLGWLLVTVGLLLALIGMGVRGAIVPGDYAGLSNWEIWMDQIFIAVVLGGASISVGLFCILRIGK